MIKIEAINKEEHVDITLNINGRGDEVAEEVEAIVTELYVWMLKESKPMFIDHLAKMVAKGLGLMIEGFDNKEVSKSEREGAN